MRYDTYPIISGLISFFVGLAEIILGIRVVLRLFSANPSVAFVGWIYETSSSLMAPFRGIFPQAVINRGYVLDFSAIFAMLVYGLVGYLVLSLVATITRPRNYTTRARERQ